MKSELNLFIIWEKASYLKDKIINDINIKFRILDVYEVIWDKEKFSNNLTRFYGQKLPKNSFKEKHCGNGPFTLIIVKDNEPKYESRMTSRGPEIVNKNMFDAKQLYREWTGGGHKIHSTNSEVETNHDITLLLGINVKDYLNKYNSSWDGNIRTLKENIIGSNGWKDIKTLFYVLNSTTRYAVLRNYEDLFNHDSESEHQDIDLLVENYYDAAFILNGTKKFNRKHRVLNNVKINGKDVLFDLRFLGDNYYDKKFEENILNNRIFINEGIYVPNNKEYFYSLLYHAIIHKIKMADDYKKRLVNMADALKNNVINKDTINDYNILKAELDKYMNENEYSYTEPKDTSVFYNSKLISNKITMKRAAKQAVINTKKKIKYLLK